MMALTHVTATASFRTHSEDRVLVEDRGGALLVVVADGAGGIPGGDRAAERFVAHVRSRAPAAPTDRAPDLLVDVLREADRLVSADREAGETTGIALLIHGESIVGAASGDSEAWRVSADSHVVLTAGQKRKRRIGGGSAEPVAFAGSVMGCTLLVGTAPASPTRSSAGGPRLVLLHGGFIRDRRSWTRAGFVERLEGAMRRIAVDLRGHGGNGRETPRRSGRLLPA